MVQGRDWEDHPVQMLMDLLPLYGHDQLVSPGSVEKGRLMTSGIAGWGKVASLMWLLVGVGSQLGFTCVSHHPQVGEGGLLQHGGLRATGEQEQKLPGP